MFLRGSCTPSSSWLLILAVGSFDVASRALPRCLFLDLYLSALLDSTSTDPCRMKFGSCVSNLANAVKYWLTTNIQLTLGALPNFLSLLFDPIPRITPWTPDDERRFPRSCLPFCTHAICTLAFFGCLFPVVNCTASPP